MGTQEVRKEEVKKGEVRKVEEDEEGRKQAGRESWSSRSSPQRSSRQSSPHSADLHLLIHRNCMHVGILATTTGGWGCEGGPANVHMRSEDSEYVEKPRTRSDKDWAG